MAKVLERSPYQTDYYAWTKQQAAELRKLAAARVNTTLDLENLAEEVESSGRSDLATIRSQLRRIIEHLLKLEHSLAVDPRFGWRESVIEARDVIPDVITATLRCEVEAELACRARLRDRTTGRAALLIHVRSRSSVSAGCRSTLMPAGRLGGPACISRCAAGHFAAVHVAPAAALVVDTKVAYLEENYLRLTKYAAGFAVGGARGMAADDDLDLRSLDDGELVKQMQDDLYDGLKEEVEEGVRILLERGWQPYDVLTEALVGGMTVVGIDFRDGILFVPEVLLAANAMKGGMAILRPLLAETGARTVGKMVIGTVKGDIHDIGKNLVSMMMEGAGFDVVDLGINCAVEKYLDALEEHKPDILGMSALLTTTMPYMKVVIDTMREKGIRDDYIVLVGGAPLNEAFAQAVGADAYCRDAAVAVETAKTFVARRHNQAPAQVAACA